MTTRGLVSIGVAAAVGPELVEWLAPAIEEAGFHALWVNDIPGADALGVLQAAAKATTRLGLATGVLPVDRRSPARIIADVAERGLPQERLTIGVGAGLATTGALDLVGDAVAELRDSLSARVVVGALGPRMRRLAVTAADGVLLSWLTPEVAREQGAEARGAASGAHVALYARTALDPAARERLDAEAQRYAAIPSYTANLARHSMPVGDTVLDASRQLVSQRLEAYRDAVDEVVLRAITPADSTEDYIDFIDGARALL
ncbi:LLM class flavin-dependent oxidoreductase [Microbacterium deminutum]|uniref:TIGR03620 family F420-dependent LLM class oxidoreductase n=1 Tax=Microbacterium deminutum TaxID=344164 RepID=A0ABN2QY10_9MICO